MQKHQAYNNDAAFRKQVLAEIKRHEELDMFQSGIYGEGKGNNFRGCAIGCTIHSLNLIQEENFLYSSHESVAEALDVPVELCYLIDKIFENLPTERRKKFTYRVWSSIQAGADTSDVPRKMKIWILQRTLIACEDIKYEKIADVKAVIQDVIDALEGVGDLKAADAATARAAAYAAAVAAARAADAAAAGAAAVAAARAVAAATWAVVDSAWAVVDSAWAADATAAAWAAYAAAAAARAAEAANAVVDSARAADATATAADATEAAARAADAAAAAAEDERTVFWTDLEDELVRLLKETAGIEEL
jgi:hypothetical protein